MSLLALTAFIASTSISNTIDRDLANLTPTVNLSAIREIHCDNPDNPKQGWTGSGSLIAKNTLLTAYHVAKGTLCYDMGTGAALKTYYIDKSHDLALMTGKYPVMPYIKVSCAPYRTGMEYNAYGISGFMTNIEMFRQSRVTYLDRHTNIEYGVEGAGKGMAMFRGHVVPGMSGGPYLDVNGYQHGLVNAGMNDYLGIPTGLEYSYELTDTILCRK